MSRGLIICLLFQLERKTNSHPLRFLVGGGTLFSILPDDKLQIQEVSSNGQVASHALHGPNLTVWQLRPIFLTGTALICFNSV